MIKALFFDIDGTLVSFNTHRIPASAISALKQAKDKGLKIFIATGRPKKLINNLTEIEELIDGYVTTNGAYCFASGTDILFTPISEPDVKTVMRSVDEYGVACIIVGKYDVRIHNITPQFKEMARMLAVEGIKMDTPLDELLRQGVVQMTPFFNREQELQAVAGTRNCISSRWFPDFTDITEPQLLFDFGTAAIDGDIIYDRKNKEYVLFFKDEGLPTVNNGFKTRQGVMRATAKTLTGPYAVEYRHLQKPGLYPVEGSSVFRLIGSDEYILMYDCYAKGCYQFCRSTDLKAFTYVQDTPTKGTFTPRHGSVMHISAAERERLEAWSELATAIHDLGRLPSPTLTLKQIDSRRKLLAEAQQVLATSANAKLLRKTAARLNAFAR